MNGFEAARRRTEAILSELHPRVPHPAAEEIRRRYLSTGHAERLSRSYAACAAAPLPPGRAIGIFGAAAVEGFLAARLFPEHEVRLYGSPERLVYRSPDDYTLDRLSEPGPEGESYIVKRLNLDTGRLPANLPPIGTAICFETIEHLRRDPLALLCSLNDLLSPEGLLFVSTPNANSSKAILRSLEWESPLFFPSYGPPPYGVIHAHEFAVLELLAILDRAGFDVLQLESFDHSGSDGRNHDSVYRCRPLVEDRAAAAAVVLPPPSAALRKSAEELSAQPLRGDYLLVKARAARAPNREPFAPLYLVPS